MMRLRTGKLILRLPAALKGAWQCVPAGAGDRAFLQEVFASTRSIELELLGPDTALRDAFIQSQMLAQRRSVELHYPAAIELILRHHGQPAGRLWLHEDHDGLRVVDITVLPAFQRMGGASSCLQALLQLADADVVPIHLHVLRDNPVRHWYARLGFDITSVSGLYQAMTRIPTIEEHQHEQT
ncbi:MAG TPA: GNAT family N-acetyltransferase [Aquabacterium sp.]|uniref:GNAT family N-acetyltransferase n=1 Tax=Aquabacterium sp. TaxID=1872578 RepID=UPI002E3820C9|nr:GNAT family N-acetyltransferase [Aquabacterium sp.]HEX5356094.1 GNAT family N-acetyltransferase [Aquabacterium sp.]